MSILDAVIETTAARRAGPAAVVVAEQHDVGAINWVGGMTDPGEMIGCGMYQNLRRLDGESDRDYAARLPVELARIPAHHRAKIETTLKGAAVRRASLDTTGGRVAVMVAGVPAWHGLGVNVAEAVTAADAIRLAGLDWSVTKRPMSYRRADGAWAESDQAFAVVRDDSESQLGTVGPRYQPIQNRDGFDFLDAVIGEFGARYHTAGAVHGGRAVWMQCELPRHSFMVTPQDEVQAFAMFSNCHDGSGKAWCLPTTNRVVCANTFRAAAADRSKGLGIRHTGDVKASIADARQALGLAVAGVERFREAAGVMARTPVDAPAYFADLLDAVCEVTAADAERGADALAATLRVTEAVRDLERKRLAREIDRRNGMLEDILRRYESDRCGVGGIRGTQWAAFNAVTEHADHRAARRVGSPEAQASRRFESVLTGDADALRQTAFQLLAERLPARA